MSDKKMRAVRMHAVKDLRLEEVEIPKPAPDEVLLKIQAVGVCGSDIPRALFKGPHVLPITLGHEFAGEVVELGSEITEWNIGDRAAVAPLLPDENDYWSKKGNYSLSEGYKYYGSRNDGAFAEYLAVKAKNMVELPENIPYDWGATVDPAANAIHAAYRADLSEEDESIAVFGLGAIGLFAVQYAKSLNIKNIIAVDIDNSKLDLAKKYGATFVLNGKEDDVIKEILEHTNNKGVDVSLEMSGTEICEVQSVAVAAKMGRVVYLGISNKSLTFPPNVVDRILRHQISIKGSWNSFSDPFPGKEWTESVRLMAEGKFNPEEMLTQKLDLKEVPNIFKKLDDKDIDYIKIMFYPNDNEKTKE